MSSPSPASLASMVNSTGRLAGTPDAFRPGPLARTLLASWAGRVLILKGLKGETFGRLDRPKLGGLYVGVFLASDLRGTS